MWLGRKDNKHGTGTSLHKCDTCGVEFTVTPEVKEGQPGWDDCGSQGCPSYDPQRDIEILYMSDAEIAREKNVISMDLLRKRKFGGTGGC